MKLKTQLLIIFFFWLHSKISSQDQAYIQYTSKDGLPANNTYMGFQDSKGYIYFGTDAGLSRFDGYSFKNFDIQDGLPDNDIFDMLEDQKGRIWFATYNGKLGYLKDEKIYNSSNTSTLKNNDLSVYISCIYKDSRDNIWFGSRYDGIKYLDANDEFHNIQKSDFLSKEKATTYTYAIWENNQKEVFALTNYSLENLTQKTSISLKDIGISIDKNDLRHFKILPLDNGELLFTENSNFYILDKDYQKVLKKFSYKNLKTTVLFLEKNSNEKIYAGTYNGMFELNFDTNYSALPVKFLNGLTVSSRKIDNQGNTWCTTLEKGVYFLPSTKVKNYTANNLLPEKKVNAIDGNDNGDIIIGQKRFYSLLKDEKLTKYSKDPLYELKKIKKNNKHIYDVSINNNGTYMVISSSGVIVAKNNEYNYFANTAKVAVNFKNDSIAIGYDHFIKAKITDLDSLSYQMEYKSVLKNKLLTSIYWDKINNCFWIGLINGLIKLKGNKIFNISDQNPLLKATITDIKPAEKNNDIWISTNGKGVYLLDKNGTIKLHFTKDNGLSSNICKTLTLDEKGKLWIGTNLGLNKVIDEANKTIVKYGVYNGLLSNKINDLYSNGNQIWVATNEGLSVMNIDHDENYTTPIIIDNTFVNGKKIIFQENENIFNHDQNNISISYVALDYIMGGEILYRYKIKEHQDWQYTYNNTIDFSSLGSGNYAFIVQARNNQGSWSNKTKTLNFTINKPWWLTWWAITLYITGFLTLLFVAYQYESKKRKLRLELLLEKKESLRFKELDKFKSQFFTNISHEIKTPLTLINGYVSDLNFETSTNKTTAKNLKKQVHEITNMVDSVLDLAKIQSSNFELNLKEVNLSNLIRKLYMNFKPLFDQKNITFTLNGTSINYFSNIDTIYFEKALNNLFVNAVKYTEKGSVSINVREEGNHVILEVSDTGIGISNKDVKNVFKRFYQANNRINSSGGSGIGLAFCKEIIELHNGQITLRSEPEIGSKFIIKVPFEFKQANQEIIVDSTVNSNKFFSKNSVGATISSATFLIVDDNFEMRKYLISILKNSICFEATDGLEAIEIIEQKKIDFIITDYMMPKLNGYELVSKLNENNSSIPIIMLTAKTDTKSKLDVLNMGVNDYITKPFNKEELLTRIKNCLKNNLKRKAYIEEYKIDEKIIAPDTFLDDLKHYIFENSSDRSLNQEVISEKFNVSKSSFYRKIKSRTGLSPNSFIKEIRLQKAREIIMKNPDISLKELSYEVGFSHTSYFSKVYKDRFGAKPLSEN